MLRNLRREGRRAEAAQASALVLRRGLGGAGPHRAEGAVAGGLRLGV